MINIPSLVHTHQPAPDEATALKVFDYFDRVRLDFPNWHTKVLGNLNYFPIRGPKDPRVPSQGRDRHYYKYNKWYAHYFEETLDNTVSSLINWVHSLNIFEEIGTLFFTEVDLGKPLAPHFDNSHLGAHTSENSTPYRTLKIPLTMGKPKSADTPALYIYDDTDNSVKYLSHNGHLWMSSDPTPIHGALGKSYRRGTLHFFGKVSKSWAMKNQFSSLFPYKTEKLEPKSQPLHQAIQNTISRNGDIQLERAFYKILVKINEHFKLDHSAIIETLKHDSELSKLSESQLSQVTEEAVFWYKSMCT
jgi:hypothetical protein